MQITFTVVGKRVPYSIDIIKRPKSARKKESENRNEPNKKAIFANGPANRQTAQKTLTDRI